MKKRGKAIKIILITIGVTAAVLAAASGVFVYTELSKIGVAEKQEFHAPENEFFEMEHNSDDSADAPRMAPEDVIWPSGDEPDPEMPAFPENAKPSGEMNVINILLIGQDKRPGEKRARSDAIIIACYSKADKALRLISLMRDMYVPIPGYSDNRINAAYQFGGMHLLEKTVEKDFGVSIDGNIEVDFDGFIQLVDLLGGIDMTLSRAEAAHLNQKFGWKLIGGQNHLNGQQTLEYARIRRIGQGDFERTDRQRAVLTEIYDSVSKLNMTRKYQMLDKMLPYLTTDMSKQEILGCVYAILTGGIKSTESYRIPAEGGYKMAKIRDMAVLVPNLAKARALLKDRIC